jgi:Amiloride-sensitive sodium channel
MIKVPKFGFSEYLGSIGGILGLVAGMSFISVVELFYHITLKIFGSFKAETVKIHPQTIANTRNLNQVLQVNNDHALYQLTKYFIEFIRTSDIPGMHYIIDSRRNKLVKVFWSTVVTLSLSICCVVIIDTVQHSELNPVIISLDEKIWKAQDVRTLEREFFLVIDTEHSFQIPFPALTYCPDPDNGLYELYKFCHIEDDFEECDKFIQRDEM